MKNYSKIILSILIQLQICNGYCSGICSDSLSGKLNYNKAIKNLYETVNYDSAIYYLDAAKAIWIQFGNQEDLCKCYTHEAYLYLNLGEYNKALKILQKAETIGNQNNFNRRLTRIYNMYGLVYKHYGDLYLSLEYFERSISLSISVEGINALFLASCYHNKAMIYDKLKKYELAEKFFLKSLEVELLHNDEVSADIATSYNSIGGVYYNKQDYEKANIYFTKAINIYSKVYGDRHPQVASCYFNIGETFEATYKFNAALKNFNIGLEVWRAVYGDFHKYVGLSYNALARVHRKLRLNDKAYLYYQLAIKALVMEPNSFQVPLEDLTINKIGSYEFLLEVLIGKGDFLFEIWED